MNPPMQPSLHLIVIGAALAALGLRPAAHPVAPPPSAAPIHAQTIVKPLTMRRIVVNAERHLPAILIRREHHNMPSRPTRVSTSGATSGATARTGPTSWRALDEAIARIPSYRPGTVRWVVSNRYGHWGTTDWYDATLYIAPTVPPSYLYDVVVHEWSHELTVLDYAGDVQAATAATNHSFGGSGLTGEERAADCMALLQGATWTHYTSCDNAHWRAAASRLLVGERL